MSASSNVAPVIIKRKKVVSGGGHHGGAWKVAYADFVTAMMAFFMLMWLLNATTEKQRKGLADYFSPTIPVNRISGGGDGAFGGDSMMSEKSLPQTGSGASHTRPTEANQSRGSTGVDTSDQTKAEEAEAMAKIERALTARGGESMLSDHLQRHIVTRLSDEGLIIDIFARDGAPLFVESSDEPQPILREIAGVIAEVAGLSLNQIAVEGHIRAHPVVLADNPVWDLSASRANRMRALLQQEGLPRDRVDRVTGHADRQLAVRDPMSNRNNRLEVILLRR